MTLPIHTSPTGAKYIGYSGDFTEIASGQEVADSLESLLNDFSGVTVYKDSTLIGWRDDGNSIGTAPTSTSIGDAFFKLLLDNDGYPSASVNARNYDSTNIEITVGNTPTVDLTTHRRAVAYSNGTDLGVFAFEYDEDNQNGTNRHYFIWAGEVKGNGNITSPQTRCVITNVNTEGSYGATNDGYESVGVYQEDNTQVRVHYSSGAKADHSIDCGENAGKLYLIENINDRTVGYCDNLFLSKENHILGEFVEIEGVTDGGSTEGIVVGKWGNSAYIVMRVYDGS